MVKRDILYLSSPHVEHRTISDDEMLRAHIMHRTVVSANGCWEWQGTRSYGYGYTMRGRKRFRVHRLAYELWNGPIQKGYVVRHSCDNPACANPSHLETGTQADNVRDIIQRGRFAKRKLSKEQVCAIRESSEDNRSLADAHGVGIIAIRRAKSGETHRHIPGYAANLSMEG